MLQVINDKYAGSAQCVTLRLKPGQTTCAASGEHAEKGCKRLEERYRGECSTGEGRWFEPTCAD